MNCASKVEIPRSCPIIHPSLEGMTRGAVEEADRAYQDLNNAMSLNGLGVDQRRQVNIDAAIPDQCSNRAKPGHSAANLRWHKRREYPLNMHAHVQSVKAYQERDRRPWRRILDLVPAEYKDPAVNSTKGWRDHNKRR